MLTTSLIHTLLIFIFTLTPKADDILGVWLTADEDGHVEIFEENGKFFGKIIWAEDMYEDDGVTLSKDNNNPDSELRERTIKNLVIIEDFVFENGEWRNGNIYDPNNGRTYSARMRLRDGKLHLRGYIGFSMIGRTEVWTRLETD